jgi:hypothetical protein
LEMIERSRRRDEGRVSNEEVKRMFRDLKDWQTFMLFIINVNRVINGI